MDSTPEVMPSCAQRERSFFGASSDEANPPRFSPTTAAIIDGSPAISTFLAQIGGHAPPDSIDPGPPPPVEPETPTVPVGAEFTINRARYRLEADETGWAKLAFVPRCEYSELQDIPQPRPMSVEMELAGDRVAITRRWKAGTMATCRLCRICDGMVDRFGIERCVVFMPAKQFFGDKKVTTAATFIPEGGRE